MIRILADVLLDEDKRSTVRVRTGSITDLRPKLGLDGSSTMLGLILSFVFVIPL